MRNELIIIRTLIVLTEIYVYFLRCDKGRGSEVCTEGEDRKEEPSLFELGFDGLPLKEAISLGLWNIVNLIRVNPCDYCVPRGSSTNLVVVK